MATGHCIVFAEPPVDICYQEDFPRAEGARVFSVEFLPGQFDQRADLPYSACSS